MAIGMQMLFQNPGNMSDVELYKLELKVAELAEPMGFDILWSVEHHFDAYSMCPDNMQFLSWVAGRTSRIGLGTAAIILPWNNPLRVVEKMILLDHLSNGRAVLGMGRGLARMEYRGFMTDMNEARDRFDEAAKMILQGLETGVVEGKGPFYPQERTEIRPGPYRSFKGRQYMVAMSPDSVNVAAELGIRMMIFSQFKPQTMRPTFDTYRRLFKEHHGTDAPPPLVIDFLDCDYDVAKSEARARKHVIGYFLSVLQHYEMLDEKFGKQKGYEAYAVAADIMRAAGKEASSETFLDVQAWGSPKMIIDRLAARHDVLGDFETIVCPSYSGLSFDEIRSSLELFSKEVMPAIREMEGPGAARSVHEPRRRAAAGMEAAK